MSCGQVLTSDLIKQAITKKDMFCFQCQETQCNIACTKKGMCGKLPATANLLDVLVQKLKQISLVCEDGAGDIYQIGRFICRGLFSTITNANFDNNAIIEFIKDADAIIQSVNKPVQVVPLGVQSSPNEDINSLREVIIYGLKGIAAYTEHAAKLDKENPEIYQFLVKALAATTKDISAASLLQLVLDTGTYAVE